MDKTETLLRVTYFDLHRGSDRIPIRVREAISGRIPDLKFIATPWLDSPSGEEFYGFGDSESDALNDCLEKIKDVSIERIFELAGQ